MGLDKETLGALKSFEDFFDTLFDYPDEFRRASNEEKRRLVDHWIGRLDLNDEVAAAKLGMVRAAAAREPLERKLRGGAMGRFRWVCTRSLGRVGDAGSIPVLAGLLESVNRNTQVFARVGLIEITGKDFGDDKDRWLAWYKAHGGVIEEPADEESSASEGTSSPVSPGSSGRGRLEFFLPDACGRMVDARDYAGHPVLVMAGSCWCGGCQQDAEPLRQIAEEFADRGLATVRLVAGDNELAALDFQKHYRLGFVQLMDTDRGVEKKYNQDGWTFLMLADRNGKIVYRINSPRHKDWAAVRDMLRRMLADPVENTAMVLDATAYAPETLDRSGEREAARPRERFPSVACDDKGCVYVVFTTDAGGTSDVYLRWYDGAAWSRDIPVAATEADEYDATVLIDAQSRINVAWTSNKTGRYEVYLSRFDDPAEPSLPVRLTRSDDDAMHPRMACGDDGRLWVTYYKWADMGGRSRDRELYVTVVAPGREPVEFKVSPDDVPDYEDHADPGIITRNNEAIICWSWDFHQPEGYDKDAREPTIFLRPVMARSGNVLTSRYTRPTMVGGMSIDSTPVIGLDASTAPAGVWCAWESADWDSRQKRNAKRLCVREVAAGLNRTSGEILPLTGAMHNICTPSFARGAGPLTLLWSESSFGDRWQLKRMVLSGPPDSWSPPQTVSDRGDPRFASGAYDSKGVLWVAWSAEIDGARKIVVRNTAEPE